MTQLRTALFLALAAAAMSCGGSRGPDPKRTPTPNTLDVSIASVTLAEDCGTGPTTVPDALEEATQDEPAARSMSVMQGDRACEQSSIQLRVANGTAAASKVTIQKVEVLDSSGNVVGELTPREPSLWSEDTYQAWDEQVAPSKVLQISYALSAPLVARGESYTVRVTVAAGDGERTLEQRTTIEAEASLPPDAVT